ncbi:MAG: response regulator [Chloroherpetonaceae bacterium]
MLIVIDDDTIVGETIADYFSDTYPIKVFTLPKEALAFVQTDPFFPQVFIVDYRMPEINGGQVARAIKKLNKDFQVILISGFSDFDDIQALLKQKDIDEFHRKPLDFAALKKSIEFRRKMFLKKSAL